MDDGEGKSDEMVRLKRDMKWNANGMMAIWYDNLYWESVLHLTCFPGLYWFINGTATAATARQPFFIFIFLVCFVLFSRYLRFSFRPAASLHMKLFIYTFDAFKFRIHRRYKSSTHTHTTKQQIYIIASNMFVAYEVLVAQLSLRFSSVLLTCVFILLFFFIHSFCTRVIHIWR